VLELAIRDLKDRAGMAHCPSGTFNANAAWAVLATVAHNMIRWLASLGLEHIGTVVAKTIRRKYIAVPGRLTHRSRRQQLHLPTQLAMGHRMGRMLRTSSGSVASHLTTT
jgi:hypothetical protein